MNSGNESESGKKRRKSDASTAIRGLVAEGFFSRFSFGAVNFVLPLYAHDRGLSISHIGLLVTINQIACLLLRPLSGWLVDRIGAWNCLRLSIVVRSVVAFAFVSTGSVWHLFALRLLYGGAQSLRDPSLNIILSRCGTAERQAQNFAWYSTAKNCAGSCGAALAGYLLLLSGNGYAMVFGVAFVLSLLPLFATLRYTNGTERADTATTVVYGPSFQEGSASVHDTEIKTFASCMIFAFVSTIGSQMFRGLLPLLAREYAGLHAAETGTIIIVSTGAVLVAGPLFGYLGDHGFTKAVLMTRSLLTIFSSVILFFNPNFTGISLSKIFDDTGKMAFKPIWAALIARIAALRGERQGRVMGYLVCAEDLGTICGPLLATALWSLSGFAWVLGARMLIAIVAEIYGIIIMRDGRIASAAGCAENEKVRD